MYRHAKSCVANRLAVVLAGFFCVMNVAFLTVPYVMQRHPGEAAITEVPASADEVRRSINTKSPGHFGF